MTSIWDAAALRPIAAQQHLALPLLGAQDALPCFPGFYVWDMWQIARRDGSTAVLGGRAWWFFLAVPRGGDPEARHDAARIRLTSRGQDGWRDHGWVFPPHFTPGSREWSGCAVLDEDGATLTLYFTAAGRRGCPRTYEQRMFACSTTFAVADARPVLGAWSDPVALFDPDPRWYARAEEAEAPAHGIKGFRDPGCFRDPADGRDHLLFTGNAADEAVWPNGVIGAAVLESGGWSARPPILSARGVCSEMERPHVIVHAGRYYLFWSTQASRFAPGIAAPTGLYGMVADRFDGPWRPLNGTGLVAANPPRAPRQTYCWWVTGECEVLSFVDYWRLRSFDLPSDPAARRHAFGGTVAPIFRLAIDGDRVSAVF